MPTQAGLDTSVWPCKSWAMTGKGMTIDVGDWLRGLGLGQYESAFRENEINEKVLPHLTAEDLKDLGVSIVGQLLDAIAALRTDRAQQRAPASTVLRFRKNSPLASSSKAHH